MLRKALRVQEGVEVADMVNALLPDHPLKPYVAAGPLPYPPFPSALLESRLKMSFRKLPESYRNSIGKRKAFRLLIEANTTPDSRLDHNSILSESFLNSESFLIPFAN